MNAGGGKIFVGIEDDGTISGLSNPDGEILNCVNSINNAIKTDVTPFTSIVPLKLDRKSVINHGA